MGNNKTNRINTNEFMDNGACFVIPAKAGIQKIRNWIPGQARNDIFKPRHHTHELIDNCLKAGLSILLLTSYFLLLASLTGCGRRGDPFLPPSYDDKIIEGDSGDTKEGETSPSGSVAGEEAAERKEPEVVIPDAPSEVAAVYTGRSIVLVWKEVLKQGVTAYRIYRSSGEGYALIAETVSPAYTDRDVEKDKTYIYKITAAGQSESLPSEEIAVLTEDE